MPRATLSFEKVVVIRIRGYRLEDRQVAMDLINAFMRWMMRVGIHPISMTTKEGGFVGHFRAIRQDAVLAREWLEARNRTSDDEGVCPACHCPSCDDPNCMQVDCSACTGEYCVRHQFESCDCDVIERHDPEGAP